MNKLEQSYHYINGMVSEMECDGAADQVCLNVLIETQKLIGEALKEQASSIDLLSGNQASVYIFAARYAHTRMTGAALQVVNEILSVWDRLPERVQQQLKIEAKNEATCNFEDWERLIAR